MLTQFSLRLRIFLLFAGLTLGAELAVILGLYFGYQRLGNPDALSGFIIAGTVAGTSILALGAWIWMLFDEHVAKAIERLSADLRARTHAAVGATGVKDQAKYLGDLAPAVAAASENMAELRDGVALAIQRETTQLSIDKTHLEKLISAIPNGVILVSSEHSVILYNAQVAELIGVEKPLGLGRSLFDYLQKESLIKAYDHLLASDTRDVALELSCIAQDKDAKFQAQMRLFQPAEEVDRPSYVVTFRRNAADVQPAQSGSVTYAFDLISKAQSRAVAERKLRDLTCVVFDTETTGLLPSKGDEIVQIAALRCVNGKQVAGETFESLVNPGRAIPAASTAVHHITDKMVENAPDIAEVGRKFHQFAEGAVLVAHNAPFDLEFLRRHETDIGARFDHPVLDTVLLSSVIFGQHEDHTLDALTERLGITIPDDARHSAMGDTIGTTQAFLKLLPMLEARGLETFAQVIAEVKKHRRLLKDLN